MTDQRVLELCREYSIEIIGKSRYPEPGQTRATETMARIIRRRGIDHMRLVLSTLRETANNSVLLDESGLWAASDLVRVCSGLVEHRTSEWLALFDETPIGELQSWSHDLSGFVPVRHALTGMIYERIVRRFGPRFEQPDLFDDKGIYRANAAA